MKTDPIKVFGTWYWLHVSSLSNSEVFLNQIADIFRLRFREYFEYFLMGWKYEEKNNHLEGENIDLTY